MHPQQAGPVLMTPSGPVFRQLMMVPLGNGFCQTQLVDIPASPMQVQQHQMRVQQQIYDWHHRMALSHTGPVMVGSPSQIPQAHPTNAMTTNPAPYPTSHSGSNQNSDVLSSSTTPSRPKHFSKRNARNFNRFAPFSRQNNLNQSLLLNTSIDRSTGSSSLNQSLMNFTTSSTCTSSTSSSSSTEPPFIGRAYAYDGKMCYARPAEDLVGLCVRLLRAKELTEEELFTTISVSNGYYRYSTEWIMAVRSILFSMPIFTNRIRIIAPAGNTASAFSVTIWRVDEVVASKTKYALHNENAAPGKQSGNLSFSITSLLDGMTLTEARNTVATSRQ